MGGEVFEEGQVHQGQSIMCKINEGMSYVS